MAVNENTTPPPSPKVPQFRFDKRHRACRCPACVYKRLCRLLDDLEAEFGPPAEDDQNRGGK